MEGVGILVALLAVLWLIVKVVSAIFGFAGHQLDQVLNHFYPPLSLVDDASSFYGLYALYAAILAGLFGVLFAALYNTGNNFANGLRVSGAFVVFVIVPLFLFQVHLPLSSTTDLSTGVCGSWLHPTRPYPTSCQPIFNSFSSIADVIILIGLACPFALMGYRHWDSQRKKQVEVAPVAVELR